DAGLITDSEFAKSVVGPTFDAVMNTAGTAEEKNALLREILGTSKEIIKLFSSSYGRDVAEAIWGAGETATALDPQAPSDVPVRSPANVIVGDAQTQGLGTVPNAMMQVGDAGLGHGVGGGRGEGDAERDPRTGGDPLILFSGQLMLQA